MSFYPIKTSLVVLCVALWQAEAQVPTFTSLQAAGGTRANSGNGLAIDAAGNSYVAGSFGDEQFDGTIDFGPTNLVSAGKSDGFVAKFSPQGQCVWARQMAGADPDDAYDVVVRTDGSIVVLGEFVGTTRIGTTALISHGGYDLFLAAFSSVGDLLWAQAIGGTSDEFASGLAPAPDGGVLFTGNFAGSINLEGGIFFNSADEDALLIKFTAAGTVQWARTGGGNGFQLGSDVKVDSQGNIYWAGEFETNIIFGATTLTSSGFNVFLAKYDGAGNRLSARTLGDGEFAEFPRIALSPNGGVLCSAAYGGAYVVGGQQLPLPSGRDDVVVASFDAADMLRWVNTFGGFQIETVRDVLVDAFGGSYLVGHYRGNMSVGNTNLPNSGVSDDVFIIRCSAAGQVQGAIKAGGIGEDNAAAAAMTSTGELRLTGFFSGTAQFGSLSATSPDELHKVYLATALPAPTLRITGFPTHVVVSWPGRYINSVLQRSSTLAPSSWSSFPIAPALVNGEFVVTNQISGVPQFFRLRD